MFLLYSNFCLDVKFKMDGTGLDWLTSLDPAAIVLAKYFYGAMTAAGPGAAQL